MRNIIYILFLFISINLTGQRTVAQWKTLFDAEWNSTSGSAGGMNQAMQYANSGGFAQEYYYIGWNINAICNAFYATGDLNYLEDALLIALTMIDNDRAVTVNGSYRGWTNTSLGGKFANEGVPLYESYSWRYVATLLRVMYQSPTLRGTAHGLSGGVWTGTTTWGDVYDDILAWTLPNIWTKWYNSDASHTDIYRVNVHMASHWARIGYELYLIDGDPEKLEVAENITFTGWSAFSGNSLANRRYTNTADATAYDIYQNWTGTSKEDTSHGADVVGWFALAYDLGFFGTLADMTKWANTLDNVVWTVNAPDLIWTGFLNGTSGTGGNATGTRQSSFSDLAAAGRYDSALQTRMETYYISSALDDKRAMSMAQGLYNRAFLNEEVQYPENASTGGPNPDTTLPIVTSNIDEGLEETRFKRRWFLDEPSKGSIVYGPSSDLTEPFVYPNETVREETYRTTHGQFVGGNNGPLLTPGSTTYYRFYIEDAAGNIGYSNEYSQTTLGSFIPNINKLKSLFINNAKISFVYFGSSKIGF